MTSLYNIYHGSVLADEKVVIDSNARIREKIEAAAKKERDEKRLAERAEIDKIISGLDKDESGLPVLKKNDDGTFEIPLSDDGKPLFEADENGHPILTDEEEEEEQSESLEIVRQENEKERDEIIAQAEKDAEAIIAKAKEEADSLFEHTADEASKKGYSDGLVKGQDEYQSKMDALDERQRTLESNYQQKVASVEKEVLDAVLDVVSKAFDIEYGDDGDLLLSLVDNCLNHIDNTKEILIRVNEKNYSLLQSRKDEITDKLGDGVSVEFAKDPLLSDGAGLIETDGGVYDVSIDTEFKNLIKRIRLLSI